MAVIFSLLRPVSLPSQVRFLLVGQVAAPELVGNDPVDGVAAGLQFGGRVAVPPLIVDSTASSVAYTASAAA
jgi:hypothetical protein